MIDDSEGNAKRVMLIGTALLTTIDLLNSQGLFTKNSSKIRNLGLILSMFLEFAKDAGEHICNEDGWTYELVKEADAHNVTIQGLVRSSDLVESIRGLDFASDISEEPEDISYLNPEALADYMSYHYQSRQSPSDSYEKRSWEQYDWNIEVRHT